MTRGQIRKARDKFWRDHPELDSADFAIQQVNAALDEVVFKIDEHFGIDPDGNHNGVDSDDPVFLREVIRALKIIPK